MNHQGPDNLQHESDKNAERLRASFKTPLTRRERFHRTMHYQTVDKLPNYEFGYWDETLPNWHKQGLPKEINSWAAAYEYFGIEMPVGGCLKLRRRASGASRRLLQC